MRSLEVSHNWDLQCKPARVSSEHTPLLLTLEHQTMYRRLTEVRTALQGLGGKHDHTEWWGNMTEQPQLPTDSPKAGTWLSSCDNFPEVSSIPA